MKHVLSEENWLQYSEGGLDPDTRRDAAAHLETCGECAGMIAALESWRLLLTGEGELLRESFAMPQENLDRMLRQSLDRIAEAEAVTRRRTARETILLLATLLEPIFGPGGVRAALDATRRQLPGADLAEAGWQNFIVALSANFSSVFGLSAGRLVTQAGHGLAAEA
jgi:anti-sigma factor RsiW